MKDVKVYKPKTIKDSPFPQESEAGLETSKEKGVTYGPSTIKDQPFPTPVTASNLVSSALNTKSKKILGEFSFAFKGAFQVGKYKEGVSGDLRISPDGITARNLSGETTFALDGTTGDAIFSGTVVASTIIGGDIIGVTITLGGLDNEDGIMQIRDADDVLIIQGDKLGHHYYDVLANELIKVDFEGFHAYDLSANELIKVDEDGLHGYLPTGVETLRVGADGIQGFGEDGTTFKFYDLSEVEKGYIGFHTNFPSGGENSFVFDSPAGINMYFLADKFWSVGELAAGTAYQIAAPNGLGDIDITAAGYVDIHATAFSVNGIPKAAVVPTSKGYKELYCMESPEVWFMDFCDDDKKIDPLFMEITEGKIKFIKCEEGYQVWRRRKGFADRRFEEKTRDEFEKNYKFWNTPL